MILIEVATFVVGDHDGPSLLIPLSYSPGAHTDIMKQTIFVPHHENNHCSSEAYKHFHRPSKFMTGLIFAALILFGVLVYIIRSQSQYEADGEQGWTTPKKKRTFKSSKELKKIYGRNVIKIDSRGHPIPVFFKGMLGNE